MHKMAFGSLAGFAKISSLVGIAAQTTGQRVTGGTVIWTTPTGQPYTPYPAGALLFPVLGQSTGPVPVWHGMSPKAGDPTVMMPLRERWLDEQARQRQLEEVRLIANDEPPPS
jgi:hypothetical protein